MNALFYAHSGLRYLVLLLAVVYVAVLVMGLVQKSAPGKLHRALGGAFAGTLDLQVLLGLTMVAMGKFYPQLIGHLSMMLLAAVLVHAMQIVNRKRPQPRHQLPLIGVAGALVLILGGIMAIGRSPLAMTAFTGP
jgi:heme A synthase